MASVVCIDIGTVRAVKKIRFPGIGEMQALRDDISKIQPPDVDVMGLMNRALGTMPPIQTAIKIILVVQAIFDCVLSIVRAVKRPTPGRIRKMLKCPKKLAQVLKELVEILPPIVYIKMARDILLVFVDLLDGYIQFFGNLEAQVRRVIRLAALAATTPGDVNLFAIGQCAKNDVVQLTNNAVGAAQAVGVILNVIAVFAAALGAGSGDLLDRIAGSSDALAAGAKDLENKLGGTDAEAAVLSLRSIRGTLEGLRGGLVSAARALGNFVGEALPAELS